MATLRRVTITTTATIIAAANVNRKALAIVNRSTVNVFLGNDTSVSTADGPITLGPGEGIEDSISPTAAVYGIVAAATQVVEVQESL